MKPVGPVGAFSKDVRPLAGSQPSFEKKIRMPAMPSRKAGADAPPTMSARSSGAPRQRPADASASSTDRMIVSTSASVVSSSVLGNASRRPSLTGCWSRAE
jgi:hypothetical protein